MTEPSAHQPPSAKGRQPERWAVAVLGALALAGIVVLATVGSGGDTDSAEGGAPTAATVAPDPPESGPNDSNDSNDSNDLVDDLDGTATTTTAATTSTTTLPAVSARARDASIWIDASELDDLPVSGPAWDQLVADATGDWGDADLGDQDNDHDVRVFAAALYAARVDDRETIAAVEQALDEMTGTMSDEVLAVSRNLTGYVLAADLIGYRTDEFEDWLTDLIDYEGDSRAGIDTLRESAVSDPSNHGAHARTAVLAVASYVGDESLVDTIATRFHDWLGRSDEGFEWRERYWQADPDEPRGINPVGATIDGLDVDGVLPEEQRRSGDFTVPPPQEGYVWEGLQGAVATAEILHRLGYPAWQWEDEALVRAFEWLHDVNDFPAEGDDTWQPWLVNARAGTDFPAPQPAAHGKSVGYTDWTHAG